MKRILLALAIALPAGAQVSNPSIIPVTTAPTGACLSGLPNYQTITPGIQYSCQNGTWAALAGGGASSTWPTLAGGTNTSSTFLCGTGCKLNTTGEGVITSSNAPINIVPVEQFGAVADFSGPGGTPGTGTDNTTAIQACINYLQTTLGSGQCLLKQGNYRITSALSITSSSVGIRGSVFGPSTNFTQTTLPANAPISALYIDSATADAVDVNIAGSTSTPVTNNLFQDFTIARTVAPTTAGSGCGSGVGPVGLNIRFAGNFVVDRVWSEDSACNFYFTGVGSTGNGYVTDSTSGWGYNGFNPAITVYGFYVNSSNSNPSFKVRHSGSTTNNIPGITSYGAYIVGTHLEDIFFDDFNTAYQSYGRYWKFTGSGVFQSADNHDTNGVDDTCFVTCIYVNGLTSATQGGLEIAGGWINTNTSSGIGIDVESSSGVTVSSKHIKPNAASTVGIRIVNSSNVAVSGNSIQSASTASIQLATDSDITIGNNILYAISGTPTTTFIAATGLTYSSLLGNSISGYGSTGFTLDSSSNNNIAFDAVDTTNIASACTNAGTGNTITAPTCTATVVYINTIFNEASSGNLVGTTPATCTNGCVGPWAVNGSTSTDWTYTGSSSITGSGALQTDEINSGQTNETLRWTVTTNGNMAVFGRFPGTGTTYFVVQIVSGTGVTPQNVVSGVTTNACSPIAGSTIGSYTLALSGTAFTLTAPSGSCSGTISATTGSDVGLIAVSGTNTLTAFSAKSN